MSENDIIVCFELPCHSQQTRTYKRQEGDPLILSVQLSESSARQRHPNANPQYFGYPFLVVVDTQRPVTEAIVYDLIMDRLQRWTTNVRDLHQWEAGSVSTPMEEVPIPITPPSNTEPVTEIKANGDVVTVHEIILEEGDIADEKSIVIQEEDIDSDGPRDDNPRIVGYKKGLFNLRIQSTNTQYGMSYNSFTSSRLETWEQREERANQRGWDIVLQDNDTLVCEFDDNIRAYYFGDRSGWEHATWHQWSEYIHPELAAARAAATQQEQRGITLQDCLDEFTREEQLGEDDLWYCPQCKKHQQAVKRFDIWSVPDVLVVHLKRFSNNRTLRDKIDTLVDFPITDLDLTLMVGERQAISRLKEKGEDIASLGLSDVDEPLIYDLYAVDEHLGGLGGGHYRAYAYNHTDDKWYHFDDSYVTPAQPTSAVVRPILYQDICSTDQHSF